MKIKMEQNKLLREKVETIYFALEELFHELTETKKFELTPQVLKKLNDILTLYDDVKTDLTKTYNVDLPRDTKDDPLTSITSLIIEALTLSQSLYQEILHNNIELEILFVLDNIMSRIQRTILFFHYFNFVL